MAGGYGVGASLATYGRRNAGGGLAGMAGNQEQEATQLLGAAASEETARNVQNTQLHAQQKAGNAQLGSTIGALAGSVIPGVGTLIGGVLGGLAGGLF